MGGLDVTAAYSLVNPHNYRFYYAFSRVGFSPDGVQTHGKSVGDRGSTVGLLPINSGAEFIAADFLGCSVRVKRSRIELYDGVVSARWWRVVKAPLGAHRAHMDAIKAECEAHALSVAESFVDSFGGVLGDLLKSTLEIKMVDEDVLAGVPLDSVFRTANVKKQYPGQANVEFGGWSGAANGLENASLKSFAPEIVDALEELRAELMRRPVESVSRLDSLKSSIKVFPDDVFKEGKAVRSLSDDERLSFECWLFDEFGVRA